MAAGATSGRRRGRALAAGIAPGALCLLTFPVMAVVEGDALIAVSAPLVALWCFGLPLLAGIRAWRAGAEAWPRARTVLVLVLVASGAWIGIVIALATSNSGLALMTLPAVQAVAWAIGSVFGD